MKYIDEAAKYDDFKATFWELEIEGFPASKFRIEETTLPFTKFQIETLVSGEKYFTEVEHPGEFSITIRETDQLDVRKAFKEWKDAFYDSEKGVFISQGADVEVGSEQDNIHKQMFLRLIRHKKGVSKRIRIQNEQAATRTLYGSQRERNTIVKKEIIDNVLFSFARRKARNFTALGSEAIPDRISSKYSRSGSKPELPTRKDFSFIQTKIDPKRIDVKQVSSNELEEEVLKTFTFENTKLLGFDPITFNYTSGEPLKYTVSLVADYINED